MTGAGSNPSADEFRMGDSPGMRELAERVRIAARTKGAILLLGETGTGKERLARSIHAMSSRRNGPWEAVNCASLPAESAESELFGHIRGAYTGASEKRAGLMQTAHKGTLFLDEIGDLPIATQVKLLRVFESTLIRAKGADQETQVDVRILAATSVDVPKAIRAGRFRRDLHERFQFVLTIPPLRERPEDIEDLAVHFLNLHVGGEGMNPAAVRLSTAALAALRTAPWSGNARELEKAIRGALAQTHDARKETLDAVDFVIAGQEPDGAPLDSAMTAVRAVAGFLLHELEGGRIPTATIDEIARKHSSISLKALLAETFLGRYSGAEADEKAMLLFGYTSAESVRRISRSAARRTAPSE